MHPQGGGVDFLKAKSDVTKPKPLNPIYIFSPGASQCRSGA